MNQESFNTFRIPALVASGVLVLWYFYDVNISNVQFIKDLGLEDPQIIAYVIVLAIIFCSGECLIEFSRSTNKSKQSDIQLLTLLLFAFASIITAYPKIVFNSALDETSRLDILIPLFSSLIVAFLAVVLNYQITSITVFFKFRKTILPVQVGEIFFLILLIIIGIYSINFFVEDSNLLSLIVRNAVFAVFFIIFFLVLRPKEKIYSKNKLEQLAKISESLDRQIEVNNYVQSQRWKPILFKKNIHKKIMQRIAEKNEKENKSLYPEFIMLNELAFKEAATHFGPVNNDIDAEELVLRVNLIQENDGAVLKTEDVKFKYVKLACQEVAKISNGSDIRSFFTPIAAKAYSLQLLHEGDPNELMLKLATSDQYLSELQKLFKNKSPNINYVAPNGWSALLISVANGEERTARYLLQKAANPAISTKHGASPLHFASKYGKLSLCKLLINYHADVNQKDVYGSTPLMLAARYGHSAIVEFLIQKGANVDVTDGDGKAALSYATEGNYGDICRKLKIYMKEKN